ncbi:MAG: PAS domain S-box protein [Deltaproteobacteria bacterium]|nr:PAS domain S-box protein [Deltaproteobacteria bacterium]
MSENKEPSYETLKRRLETAETALKAVRKGQVDAIMGDREILVVRLRETEAREAHIKQVLLAIRNVNQLIVKETDPQRLIDNACANLTETLGYHNAWIALLNEDSHVIRTAASGFDGGFEVLEDRLRQGEFPACMQQALAQDTLVVIEDPVSECRDCPLAREYEGRAGLTRCLSHGGKTYGILSVSVPAAFARDTEEQELFEELTDDLAFALYKIEVEERTRRLTYIVNTLPQPMSFVSQDYRYVAVNDFYAELYGVPQDRIIGKRVADFFGEAVFEAEIRPHLDRCLDGETVSYEIQADFPDKGKRWMGVEYHPYRDQQGRVMGVVSHGKDITDRKQAEEALRLHSMTLNQIEDRVTVTDIEGYITYVNEAACRMLGKSREELLGQHVSVYGEDPSTGPPQEEIVQKTLQDGVWRGEVTNYRTDGTAVILDARVQVVRDEQGRPIGLCGISTDITERKQMEDRLQQTLDATTDGIWYWHFPTDELTFSPRYYTMLGYAPDEFEANFENWLDLIHPEDRPNAVSVAQEYLQSRPDVYENEFRLRMKNGTYRWIHTRARVVERDEDGTAVLMIGHHQDITERREKEEALRQSEGKLRAMFDAAPLAIVLLDREGRVLDTNHVHAERLKTPRDQLLGHHVWNFLPPSVRADRKSRVGQVFETGAPFSGEDERDGTWNEYYVQPAIIDEKGEVQAVIVAALDITDRKQSEKELLDSRMELEQILEAIPDALIYADRDRRITRINDAFIRMFGYMPEEVLGEKTEIIYTRQEDFIEQGRQRYNVQMREKYVPYEIEYRRKNGEIFPSETAGIRVRDTQDRVIGFLALVRDISDRKQAEEALRASELQKNLILDATAEMVAYYDLDLRVIWANRAAAESVGKTPAELEGLHCYEIWDQRIDPCPGCPVLKARDTGVPQNTERQSPDGRYWFLRGYPILDDQGKSFALVEFGQDITEQKQAEERHVQLEEQMRQAQKLESIGLLAGGVAHDFNNMLGIIIANAELAEMQRDADGLVHQNVQEILKASHRAADTVRQLLAFARKQTISPKDLDLNDTVSGILNMLRRIIGENIDLRFVPGKGLWNVRMDPAQVHQLLTNLVVNSRDALPDGGRITIETANKTMDESYAQTRNGFTPGKYVLLMVSDTGEGMPPEVMDHLFDPFFTTKEVGRGTGLGLATVYGMVKQNSGFIYVYSEPGEGTTFKIYLPMHKEKTAGTPAAAVKKPVPGGNETILVAEDEEVLLQTCKHVLERQGYTVLAARKPGEALALAEQHPGEIHMLLTDVVMPEMNGRELAERLQVLRPETKCLFMSGYTADVVARHGVLDRGVEFIEKPFSFTGLATKVREVLDQKSSEA